MLATRARSRLFIRDLQQVVRECDAGNVVERSRIDRHARKVVLLQQLEKVLERDGFGHGEDLRSRRHHFAHQFVAEFDGRPHQVAVALLENSFFLSGFKQRLHVHRGLFLRADRLFRQ